MFTCHCVVFLGRQAGLAKEYLTSNSVIGFATRFLFIRLLLFRHLVVALRSLSSYRSLLYYEVYGVLCAIECVAHWCSSRCPHQALGQNRCCAEQVHHRGRS